MDYLRPTAGDDLYCEAEVIRLGNKVAVCGMQVFAGPGPWLDGPADSKVIATGRAVYNIVRKGDSMVALQAYDRLRGDS